jgi:cyclic pyranopterin phosphate synthase
MVDPFGRTISYLRVSVTDRCDLRCLYCMSEDMTFLPKADLLTLEELDRLCSAFIAKGVRKLRLTGGEPLVRRNMMSLVRSLSRQGADADHQWFAASAFRRRVAGLWRPPRQRLARHA